MASKERTEFERNRCSRCLSLGQFATLGLAFLLAGTASGVTTLELIPHQSLIGVGESTFVEVVVGGDGIPAPGLTGFQIEILFDPSVIQISDPNDDLVTPYAPLEEGALCSALREGAPPCMDPEWFLKSTGRGELLLIAEVDNQTGALEVGYGSFPDADPPTGSGTLALLEVLGLSEGMAELTFASWKLTDPEDPPNLFPATPISAGIRVIPEPQTLGLVVLGLSVLGAITRRHR